MGLTTPPQDPPSPRRGLLRRLRHWYRRLNYESASRPRTAWTIRVDVALIVTFLVAASIVWTLQLVVHRTISSQTVDFWVTKSGESLALHQTPPATPSVGTIHLVLNTVRGGWPITTATIIQNPQVSWSLPGLAGSMQQPTHSLTTLTDHLELAKPIRVALAAHPNPDMRTYAAGRQVDIDWFVFVIVIGVTWMLLWIGSLPLLGLIGAGEGMADHFNVLRRRRRRRQNRCERCGYNLSGLEFTAACPECGELLR